MDFVLNIKEQKEEYAENNHKHVIEKVKNLTNPCDKTYHSNLKNKLSFY